MTLNQHGFLSPEIEAHAAQLRAGHPAHASLVTAANAFAMGLLSTPRAVPRDSAGMLAMTLFGRVVQDFAGAVLLADRGLRAQSRAMARSTLESALYCVGACRDVRLVHGLKPKPGKGSEGAPSFAEAFANGFRQFQAIAARELASFCDVAGEDRAKLEAVLTAAVNAKGAPSIELKGLAQDLGLGHVYAVLYRQLSQDSHPSVISADHHVDANSVGKITGYRIGPDYSQYTETLLAAVQSLLMAAEAFVARFGDAQEGDCVRALVSAYGEVCELDPAAPEG